MRLPRLPMNKLTPQRLFSDPPLQGQLPTQIAIAPDGGCITYLAPGSDDRERLDLWRYDRQEKSHQPLLNAKSGHLTSTDITELTQAERAERERKRQFYHGITQYLWHPDGVHLLIPIDGQLYLVNASEPQPVWRQLTPNDTRQTSVQLSPEGTWVSYVRQGDLFAYHLAQGLRAAGYERRQ